MQHKHVARNSQVARDEPCNGLPLVVDSTGGGRDVKLAGELSESSPTDRPMEGWELFVAAQEMARQEAWDSSSHVSFVRLMLLMC